MMEKSLESLSKLMPIFTLGIFIAGFLSIQIIIAHAYLEAKFEAIDTKFEAIKEKQDDLKADLNYLKIKFDDIKADLNDFKIKLADK